MERLLEYLSVSCLDVLVARMARLKKTVSRRRQQRRQGRRLLERTTLFVLLIIVWAWTMATFGMVFYHGYYNKRGAIDTSHNNENVSPQGLMEMVNSTDRNRDPGQPVSVEGSKNNLLSKYESPLLIFTCRRDEYLRETLNDILRYIPRGGDCTIGCPIIVSQDGKEPKVMAVINEFKQLFESIQVPLIHIQHTSALRGGKNAYQALAIHYGWALAQTLGSTSPSVVQSVIHAQFSVQPKRVIILEEDLHIAPDFFSYFAATSSILDEDSSLLAVSAFNDNGYGFNIGFDKSSNQDLVPGVTTRIVRSDFFPGLGWMMTNKLWQNELQVKWPDGYWDDWLRDPAQRQGRHMLRPEISRTYHFGVKGGASANQFGGHLSTIYLNEKAVDWSTLDLSYLEADTFDRQYWDVVSSAKTVDSLEEGIEESNYGNVRFEYSSFSNFQMNARLLKLMDDEKAGIPRTAYKGVVEARPHGKHLLLLTPPMEKLKENFAYIMDN